MKGLRFAAAAILVLAGSVWAAHQSNNRAELSGLNGQSGKAIVNFVKGSDTWNANTSVEGLAPSTYTYSVRVNPDGMSPGPLQLVCSFDVDASGEGGCSRSQFDLEGFHEAVITDDLGNEIAGGFFSRRGGRRAP